MIAAYHSMKVVIVPLNLTYHCCDQAGQTLHARWQTGNVSCLLNHLIHPVKDNTSPTAPLQKRTPA